MEELPPTDLALPALCLPSTHRYLDWLKGGLSPAEAYQQRGAAHLRAHCYLQARADAALAVAALHEERRRREGEGQGAASDDRQHAKRRQQGTRRWDEAAWRQRLADVYRLQGEACMADVKHPDCDPRGATKAFLLAAELDAEHETVHDRLSLASEDVSAAVMDQVGPGCCAICPPLASDLLLWLPAMRLQRR